jgi:hypothetical protein
MCEVSWSARSCARPEMMKLRTTSDVGSCFPGFLIKHRKSDRNSVLSKNIPACTSVHLHAPACTASQSRKNVCDTSATWEGAEGMCGAQAVRPSVVGTARVNIASAQVRIDMIAEPMFAKIHWQDLGTNLASEFILSPGHTGIMDTILCVTVGTPLRLRRAVPSTPPRHKHTCFALGRWVPRRGCRLCLLTASLPDLYQFPPSCGECPSGRTLTVSSPFLHLFFRVRTMNSRSHNHLQLSPLSTGAIPCRAEVLPGRTILHS